jgi:hypothetical protein
MSSLKAITIATLFSSITISFAASQSALTIYNQNFAVVRDALKLDLQKGISEIQISDVTRHLEPQSVIVRDPKGIANFTILEQNYRADPISQGLLLSAFEGKTIDFKVGTNIVSGTILRSGYTPHYQAMSRYGRQYAQAQRAYYSGTANGQAVVKVNGKIRFGLPGIPLFPSLPEDSIFNPTLSWKIQSPKPAIIDAELCYITGGMSWTANYNMIAPETGDVVNVIGWITVDNQCGRTFKNTKIKLMAGDINKINQQENRQYGLSARGSFYSTDRALPVTEKTFDEYHLYSLPRLTTLRDRETKQIEFIRAAKAKTTKIYVYDGVAIDNKRYRGYSYDNIRNNRDYGTHCNSKIWIMRECKNTQENGLGIALPKGKVRFYRRDSDAQLEFLGENTIDHTPRNETLRFYTGNAFDLVGERKRTNYKIDRSQNWLDESFEIKIRNHKENESVEINVAEHLYRGTNWEIVESSHTYLKKDSKTIEFRVKPPSDGETVITYKVHYTW